MDWKKRGGKEEDIGIEEEKKQQSDHKQIEQPTVKRAEITQKKCPYRTQGKVVMVEWQRGIGGRLQNEEGRMLAWRMSGLWGLLSWRMGLTNEI